MTDKYRRMWNKAFDAKFLELRAQGVSEDRAIALAEWEADIGLDRYVDDKLEAIKLGE